MSTMPNLRRNRMVDDVFEMLKDKIFSGDLKLMEKLPSQEELAIQLGVSRTVIREAINKLASIGLVSCEQGRGSFITVPKTDGIFDRIIKILALDDRSNIELMEARYYLEAGIVRLATVRATREDLDEMEHIVNSLEKHAKAGNLEEWANSDLAFHIKLGEVARNKIIKTFLDSIRGVTFQYLLNLSNIPSEVDVSIRLHRGIIEAIKKGDPDLAEQKMKAHFDSVKKAVDKHLHYKLIF